MQESFPPKLIEFVNLADLKPSWAWDIRLWRLKNDYVISFAADLLRAKHQFGRVYHLDHIQKRFGWNLGVIENALYRGEFTTISDMCDAVEGLASNYAELDVDDIHCSIMPREGEPWDFSRDTTHYYSVRKNKIIESKPPPMVEMEYYSTHGQTSGRQVTGPVFDWCQVTPQIECDAYPNQIAMSFRDADRHREIYIASHCFKSLEGLRTARKQCGGLLFPSIAVGLLPSTNFGPLVLIADPQLPLSGLKPYRTRRGEYPAYVYPTDSWTVNTNQLFASTGAQALEEWVGQDFNNIMNRFALMLAWDPRGIEPLKHTRKMLARLNRLRRKYNDRNLDLTTIGYDDEDRYPYLEAKINGITPLHCYTLAFCPKGIERPYRRLLRRSGFRGQVLTVPGYQWSEVTTDDGHILMDAQQQWDYGWQIRQMILKLLHRKPHLLHAASCV